MAPVPFNNAPLDYFNAKGYSREAIDNICKELDKKYYFSRVEFSKISGLTFSISTHLHEQKQGHARAILDFMSVVIQLEDIPFKEGCFIVLHEDLAWTDFQKYSREVPVFAFSRDVSDQYTFLMPDPAFLDSGGYQHELKEISEYEKDFPFDKKEKKVFWRGTKSAGPYLPDVWKDNLRVQLAVACRDYNNDKIFDAYISRLVKDHGELYAAQIIEAGLIRGYVPIHEFFQYAYQLDIDGVGNAWISYFLKLSSLSPVLKVESQYEQWFYRSLQPWKHFIPVRKNLYDIIQVIESLPHLKDIHVIAQSANEVMKTITYPEEVTDFAKNLIRLFSCLRS